MDWSEQQQKFGALPSRQSIAAASAQPKISGRGGFLSSLISELGGAGGAAGGAAIGTALLPGIGTLLGAGLGGFLGGTGGRVVENEVRDNRAGFGDALKEGAMSGVLSGAGEAFQLAKGAKAAGIGVQDALKGGLEQGAKSATAGNLVEDAGKGFKANAMGFGQGARLNGEKIGASASDEVGNTLKQLRITAAAPETVQRKLEGRLANLRTTLQTQYEKGKYAFTDGEVNGLKNKIISDIQRAPGLAGEGKNYGVSEVDNLINNFGKDTNSLWDYTKQLSQNKINDARNAASKIPGQEVVDRIIRDNVRDTLNAKVPGVAETNNLFHKALNADELLRGASTNPTGSLTSRLLGSAPARTIEAKVGSGLEGLGGFVAGNGGIASQVANQGIRQAPGNLVEALMGAQQQQQPDQSQQLDQSFGGGQNFAGSPMDMQQGSADTQQSGMISEQDFMNAVMQDVQQTGGKHIGTIQSLYKMFGPQKAPTLNSTEAGNITDLQSSLQQLSGLSQDFANSGSNVPVLGDLLARNPFNTGAKDLQSKVALAKQIVGKALEGGVLRKEDEAKYAKILPTLNDTDAVAQRKINTIIGQIQTKLSFYKGNIGGGTNPSLQDALISQGVQ